MNNDSDDDFDDEIYSPNNSKTSFTKNNGDLL